MSPEILAAFLVGLVGSLHCIGMCGPIAIALPVPNSSNLSFFTGRILYNLGRVVTYSFLGAILGLLGGRIALAGQNRRRAQPSVSMHDRHPYIYPPLFGASRI